LPLTRRLGDEGDYPGVGLFGAGHSLLAARPRTGIYWGESYDLKIGLLQAQGDGVAGVRRIRVGEL